jgi:hypothetical protein
MGVKTSFLHGELTEEIYMNIPEGMNEDQGHCIQSKKTIYGLVQSAREFYKKIIMVLKSTGFLEDKSDTCLLSNQNKKKSFSLAFIMVTVSSLGKKSVSNG